MICQFLDWSPICTQPINGVRNSETFLAHDQSMGTEITKHS